MTEQHVGRFERIKPVQGQILVIDSISSDFKGLHPNEPIHYWPEQHLFRYRYPNVYAARWYGFWMAVVLTAIITRILWI